MMEKKTGGRRKIEMKKIEEKSKLFVTFSKRKNGLFKKAAELAVSCGGEVAVLALSGKGRAFSFGIPSPELVVNRYLAGGGEDVHVLTSAPQQLVRGQNLGVHEDDKNKNKNNENKDVDLNLNLRVNGGGGEEVEESGFWWNQPLEVMNLEELDHHKMALIHLLHVVEEIKNNNNVDSHANLGTTSM